MSVSKVPLTERKAAVDAYRDRPAVAGIYEMRGGTSAWVGATPTLDSIENRLRFTLKHGSHPNPALQAAAAEGLTFGVLETIDPELAPLVRARLLKERLAHWLAQPGARPL